METTLASVDTAFLERVRSARSLPTPPIIAARLIELGENPDVGLADLVEVLRTDPALSARILRLANSPLYARRRRAQNLHQAVVMLGLDAVFTAALSLTVVADRDLFDSPSFRSSWTRSVHAAVVAQLLAAACGGVPPGTAFLASLVQDVGILAIGRLEPDVYDGLPDDADHDRLVAREREILGTDHAEVGAVLLEAWRLPDDVVHAVAHSHLGGRTGRTSDRLADIVAVSALVADGLRGGAEQLVAAAVAAEHLVGIDAVEFSKLLDSAAETLPDLAPMLEANTPDAELLAERAAEAMIARQMQQRHAIEQLQSDLAGLSEVARQLEVANRSDLLTGLLNRRYLDEVMEHEFERSKRLGDGLSILFVDLDDFREANEEWGHHGGDVVLRTLASRMVATLRDDDLVGRYGGDEFVIVLPGTLGWQAEAVARRLIEHIASKPVTIEQGAECHQSVTIGLAALDELFDVDSIADLVRAADEALFDAKRAGKNCWRNATATRQG